MAKKLPSMQFYPGDWWKDTRRLSLAARGAWIDLICAMWDSKERGVLTDTYAGLSRLFGCDLQQTKLVIAELTDPDSAVCEIIQAGGKVTLTCRRIVRDEAERNQDRIRKQNQRARDATSSPEPPLVDSRHGPVTALSPDPSPSPSPSISKPQEGFEKVGPRSRRDPRIGSVLDENHLRDDQQFQSWLDWHLRREDRLVQNTERDKLLVYSARERAIEVGKRPVRLFSHILIEKAWHLITQAQEDRARNVLSKMRRENAA